MPRPRMQTVYGLHRSDTGRLSSGLDPSDEEKVITRRKIAHVQNIPRKLRDMFVPDPGHVFIGGDWAGIEAAITWWFASKVDQPKGFHVAILDRFQRGEFDPHKFLASHAFDVQESAVTKEQRRVAKAYTHGRDFMGSPIGLARAAGHPDKVGVRVCRAHDEAFKLKPWWDHELALVKRRRFVQTPLGWRRYFNDWKPKPQEVIATIVQATAADLCKWCLVRLFETAPLWFELLSSTHDSFLGQVPIEHEEVGKVYLKSAMEAPVPWLDGRTWRADVRSGDSWRAVS